MTIRGHIGHCCWNIQFPGVAGVLTPCFLQPTQFAALSSKPRSNGTGARVEDYALDLRDFHEQSHGRRIIPFAVSAKALAEPPTISPADWIDAVRPIWRANASDLAPQIAAAFRAESDPKNAIIGGAAWDLSAYRPVPTIVEAAEALYAGHNVREIAHSHAGAINLTLTSDKLIEIIEQAQRERLKVACFVTGVPGAGKTLAGLNVVHNPTLRQDGRPPPVFLSGNGPLVKIVSAAIARDFKRRKHADGGERSPACVEYRSKRKEDGPKHLRA